MTSCPKCKSDSEVIDSRYRAKLKTTYRRRRCLECGHRWSTAEVLICKECGQLHGDDPVKAKVFKMITDLNKEVNHVDHKRV
jgi:transcriptional regulator NrdR family protein